MSFPTKEIAGFLAPDEITVIDRMIIDNTEPWLNYFDDGTLMSTYYEFDFYDEKFSAIHDIMWPRIKKHFGDIFIGQMHIFDSITPYHVHSDVESGIPYDTAWTFIIPLDTYESHTIVFNEGSENKDPLLYAAKNPPYDPCRIDYDTWQRYLSHVDPDIRSWLSIEAVFPWRRGHLFATDRWKFHTSDNYQANGVTRKRALVAWTNTKPVGKINGWYPRFSPSN